MHSLLFYLERIWLRLVNGISATIVGTVDVEVQNFPATQTVDGTVSVNNFPASTQVSNFPATQTVNGTVNVGNFPVTQAVSGSVSVSNFPATQNVSVVNQVDVEVQNFPAGFNVNNFPSVQDVRLINPPSGGSGTAMDFVHTSPALNPGDVYTVLTYTVPVGKDLVLDFIKFSSVLDFKAEITIDGDESYNEFGSGSAPSPEYKRSRTFPAGTLFEFKLTNRAPALSTATSIYVTMAGDLYNA